MNAGPETSVVIQGPVHGSPSDPPERQLTRQVIASVRRHMPGAEIIVSTWKGSPIDHLGADLVVLNDDPGAVTLADSGFLSAYKNNLNRQLVSTQAGLRTARRRYAVKLRSDTLCVGPSPVARIAAREPTGPRRIFRGQVAVFGAYHPLKRPVLFYLNDLFHAGLREDLLMLWEIPLVAEPGFTRSIDPERRPLMNLFSPVEYLFRAAPEQYLGECLCRRLDDSIWLRHPSQGQWRWLELWLAVLASNFCLVRPDEAGVKLPDRLASCTGEPDVIQPEEHAELRVWSRATVPISTRWRAAWRFQRMRWRYARPQLRTWTSARLPSWVRHARRRLSSGAR
jgi:hypothetical protein